MAGERGKYGDVLSALAKYRTAAIAGTLVLALVGTMVAVKRTGSSPQAAAGTETPGDLAGPTPTTSGGPAARQIVSSTAAKGSKSVAKTPYHFTTFTQAKKKGIKVAFGPDCDTATGRIKVPAIQAPPCVPAFPKGADNGGKTYRGVAKDTLTVAYYITQYNQAALAVYYGTGSDAKEPDPEAQQKAALQYLDYFQHHYEMYGRKVNLVFVKASGSNTDATAAKADAIRVATDIKAFASLGGPDGAPAYAKTLAAHGVICMRCLESMPRTFYSKQAPYNWGLFPYMGAGLGEWIGKRLWGRPARWAGDPVMQTKTRRFAHVHVDSADGDRRPAAADLDHDMARFGAKFATKISYVADVTRAQEDARTIVAKLKAENITTVLLDTDWVYPIFVTREATNQQYSPEWVVALGTITNLFGRSTDQTQWAHAFGPSALAARLPRELDEDASVYAWHHGAQPAAGGVQNYQAMWPFFTGVHLAGPVLTPETFMQGLFSYPPTGGAASGQVTMYQLSYGRHGFWADDDYSGIDDNAEMWWDATARGKDEVNKDGVGMFQFVDGGRRYAPGEWPKAEPRMFDPAGAVTAYPSYPKADRPPSYPHKDYH